MYKLNLESSISYGRILPHNQHLKKIILNNSISLESTIYFNTNGNKTHHAHFLYPSYGLTFNFTKSGNKSQIGNIFSSYGSITLPLQKKTNPLSFKIGLGLGWVEKVYDVNSNYQNLAIGSHLNANAQIKFEKTHVLNKKQNLKYAILLNHLSNGDLKNPNLGFNICQFQTSYSFGLKPQKIDTLLKPLTKTKKHHFSIFNSSGLKEFKITSNGLNFINETSFQFEKNFGLKSNLITGLDFLYNSTLEYEKKIEFGLIIGYVLTIGKLRLGAQIGSHIYNKSDNYRRIYNKIMAQYQLTNHLSIRASLRSHIFNADFMSIGIGYTIN
tara:strand:- start:330 stop:1310 length:981 start_codon:yes stop_codon:yes gene_type:complete